MTKGGGMFVILRSETTKDLKDIKGYPETPD